MLNRKSQMRIFTATAASIIRIDLKIRSQSIKTALLLLIAAEDKEQSQEEMNDPLTDC